MYCLRTVHFWHIVIIPVSWSLVDTYFDFEVYFLYFLLVSLLPLSCLVPVCFCFCRCLFWYQWLISFRCAVLTRWLSCVYIALCFSFGLSVFVFASCEKLLCACFLDYVPGFYPLFELSLFLFSINTAPTGFSSLFVPAM